MYRWLLHPPVFRSWVLGSALEGKGYRGGCSKETREEDGQVLDGDLGWTIEPFIPSNHRTDPPTPTSVLGFWAKA